MVTCRLIWQYKCKFDQTTIKLIKLKHNIDVSIRHESLFDFEILRACLIELNCQY